MKTTIELPAGIRPADTQSEINLDRMAASESPAGLLVIEGPKASGKTRLARHLVKRHGGQDRVMMLPNEKSLQHIFTKEEMRIAHFDDVRTVKPSGAKGRGKKLVEAPLESPAMLAAIEAGTLVILTGESISLGAELERMALRVMLLGHNVKGLPSAGGSKNETEKGS